MLAVALAAGIAEALHAGALLGDFRAFWCAGSVALHGGDPYAGSALYACEAAPQPFGLYSARDGVALPVPLPGYAVALFSIFALVPYPFAALAWCIVLLAASVAAIRALARCGVGDIAGAGAAFALPVALVALPVGELAPIALAAACGCAAALRRGAWGAAVGWASVGMIEPHVGLPVLFVLIGLERTRVRAALALVLLAALHALVVRAQAVAYFTHVLPQHALAELLRSSQYSLAWVLQSLGAAPGVALGIGTISYALALGVGISLGAVLARRRRAASLLALVPSAFVLAGGTFIHISQMALALPALLVLVPHASRVRSLALRAALLLLAIPWSEAVSALVVPLLAFAAAVIGVTALRMQARHALYAALGVAVYAGVVALATAHAVPPHAQLRLPPLDPSLAQASWSAWILAHDSGASMVTWLTKIPTWIGLALALVGLASLAREERVAGIGEDDAPVPAIA